MSGFELEARSEAFARFMGEVEDLPELTVEAWRAAFYAGWEAMRSLAVRAQNDLPWESDEVNDEWLRRISV